MPKGNYLIINPGSTSTKIAVFKEAGDLVLDVTIHHPNNELEVFPHIMDQMDYRYEKIRSTLDKNGVDIASIKAICARGGAMIPLYQGGTYHVNDTVCSQLRTTDIEHAANLGAVIADQLAKELGVNAYVVDPDCVDEMVPEAKLTGIKHEYRKAQWHTLNQKAICRKLAEDLDISYKKLKCIVCHIGGGTSVGLHLDGKTVDVNNCLEGDGPMSPQRAGGIPNINILEMVFTKGMSQKEIMSNLVGGGGFISHLGTNNAREIEEMIDQGNEYAKLVYRTMAYQVGKEIGGLAAAAKGNIDAIAITGGLAHSDLLVGWIKEYISFLAPVYIYPGEKEMAALFLGAKRSEIGAEPALEYQIAEHRKYCLDA